jgi:hypothetical protein
VLYWNNHLFDTERLASGEPPCGGSAPQCLGPAVAPTDPAVQEHAATTERVEPNATGPGAAVVGLVIHVPSIVDQKVAWRTQLEAEPRRRPCGCGRRTIRGKGSGSQRNEDKRSK